MQPLSTMFALVMGFSLVASTALADPAKAVVNRQAVESALENALEDLTLVQGALGGCRTPACKRSIPLLNRTRKRLKKLRDRVREAPGPRLGIATVAKLAKPKPAAPTAAKPPPQRVFSKPRKRVHADRNVMLKLFKAIDQKKVSKGKLRVLGQVAHKHWFSVDQVIRLLKHFRFEKDKLRALGMLAPRLTNRKETFKIFAAFKFEKDKKKARKILKSHAR